VFAQSPADCCSICSNTFSCISFTYVAYFQLCNLKNMTSINKICSKGKISGIVKSQQMSTLPTFFPTDTFPTDFTTTPTTSNSFSTFSPIFTSTISNLNNKCQCEPNTRFDLTVFAQSLVSNYIYCCEICSATYNFIKLKFLIFLK
jgi:hypothetical protein